MASTGLNYLNNFTVSNQGITDLRELLTLSTLQNGPLADILNINMGVRNGSRIGGVGRFEPIGTSQPMCNPTFGAADLKTQEKVWDLGNVTVAQNICADDFINTIVKFSMGTGTDKADLTSDDLMTIVLEPRLQEAITEALWRIFWLGDKEAANYTADGTGKITAGVDTSLFTMTDGMFKRLLAAAPTGSDRRVSIGANAQATYALQTSSLNVTGVATTIFDDLIYNADMKLRQASDRFILCTQSLSDALARDLKARNIGSDLQWTSLFDNFPYAIRYNGETIIPLPMWDQMIKTFEDTGVKWNNPHRAVFASKETLMAATEGTELFGDMKIWFSDDTQTVRLLAREDVGTMIWEEDLIQYAY